MDTIFFNVAVTYAFTGEFNVTRPCHISRRRLIKLTKNISASDRFDAILKAVILTLPGSPILEDICVLSYHWEIN